MKRWKKVEKHYTESYLESVTCDICKNTFNNNNWDAGPYEVRRTTISLEEGSQFPEGGSTIITSFDICPKCFKEILIPMLDEYLATPSIHDADW